MAQNQATWLRVVQRAERAVGSHVETFVKSDTYFDLLAQTTRAHRRLLQATETLSREWLHLWNLPASSDVRRLREQLSRFERLMGRPPTHLDSHHNVHRDPGRLPHFLAVAAEHGLPLRDHSAVRYFSKFYGQWGGEAHPEQISVESLARMLEMEIQEGVTELSCHPGYLDPNYRTGYAAEREIELRTLCDPRVREVLAEQSIRLISYHDVARLPLSAGT